MVPADHAHWRFVGLDTAWDEEHLKLNARDGVGLMEPQGRIVTGWAVEDDHPMVLFSHHPLVDGGETDAFLKQELAVPLKDRRIAAWFWGHQHKAVAYGPMEGVACPRCLGHGGVPVYPWQAKQGVVAGERWREKGDHWAKLQRWAIFGFAILDIDDEVATVEYRDEDGGLSWTEQFTKRGPVG